MTDKLGIELLREWDFHNRKHHCYYEESNDSGIEECPGRTFPTLRAFLESREYPVENVIGQFFGRDLNEPNFWSRISGQEFPVSPQRMSIRELRELQRTNRRKAQAGVPRSENPASATTDAVMALRAQEAKGAAVENEQHPWEVEALQFFKDRTDTIEFQLSLIAKAVSELTEAVDTLAERVDERSESEQPNYNIVIDMKGLAENIEQAIETAMNHRARTGR